MPEIGAVLDDGLGSFWLASHRGIIQVSRTELDSVADGSAPRLRCRLYDNSDGMPATECSIATQPNAARDYSGRLWFSTRKAAFIRPGTRPSLTNAPPVKIESVEYVEPDGRTRTLQQPFGSELVLPVDASASRFIIPVSHFPLRRRSSSAAGSKGSTMTGST